MATETNGIATVNEAYEKIGFIYTGENGNKCITDSEVSSGYFSPTVLSGIKKAVKYSQISATSGNNLGKTYYDVCVNKEYPSQAVYWCGNNIKKLIDGSCFLIESKDLDYFRIEGPNGISIDVNGTQFSSGELIPKELLLELYNDMSVIDIWTFGGSNVSWTVQTAANTATEQTGSVIGFDQQWVLNSPGGSGTSIIRCVFEGLSSITFNCTSRGENNYDYLTVGEIDTACNRSTYKYILKGSANTATPFTYTLPDSGQHYVEFCYSKDGSVDTSPDNALVYIESYTFAN